ncbi:MAG: sigma-54-dependent Fis family transcriptional regulator [Mesorhizobium amorphae]|nr:MAG: sigma-54-dependent Fis family transcriptional regulator [Mesorhizobium amorphae]
MAKATILIVDDDPVHRRLAEAALVRAGHRTLLAENGTAALDTLARPEPVSLVLLDLVMPGGPDGIAVLKTLRERGSAVPVIVQTALGGIDTVVTAMREGAFDFVVKPASPDKLLAAVARALKVGEATAAGETRAAERQRAAVTLADLPTQSPAMTRALKLGAKAAATGVPILLEGESGTGKEVMARAIQAAGPRAGRPFVTVNCGAIPDNLVESILFGHEKGAFTGATERHAGKFAEANGGTLFLDEVGDLPLDAQVKLLRAVQEGEVDPVGGKATLKVDIRLISATHRDLAERVRQGLFREDLFYRLNVFPIPLPPLRERRADIAELAARFIERAKRTVRGSPVRGLSTEALVLLQAYDWPGNIRQLENAILRAVVLAEGALLTEGEFPQIRAQVAGTVEIEVAPSLVPFELGDAPPQPGTLTLLEDGQMRSLAAIEGEAIRFALRHYRGHMSEAARRLGIGRSTLYRKIREHGIDAEEGAESASAQAPER